MLLPKLLGPIPGHIVHLRLGRFTTISDPCKETYHYHIFLKRSLYAVRLLRITFKKKVVLCFLPSPPAP